MMSEQDEGDYPAPIAAATLVLMRDRTDGGPPELLMVERAKAMAFAGGALVFPGGRVDPADHGFAALSGADEDGERAARIAAVRETLEEVGLAIGLTPLPDAVTIKAVRAALHAGQGLADAIADHGLQLDLEALVPFARWCPRHRDMRIYDTRFYLARLPDETPLPEVDATENVRLFWASAAEVLAMADDGRAHIIFPTRRNLERLAQFSDFADAVAHANAHPVRMITPWVEDRDGQPHLCIPDDLGYPVTGEALAGALRA